MRNQLIEDINISKNESKEVLLKNNISKIRYQLIQDIYENLSNIDDFENEKK
jgi:hypothetical protein